MEEEIKRFKFIGLNDKASQEHLLQNTLILSGFYSSVPARLLFVAVSRDFCYFLKSQIDAEYYGAAEPPVRCGESHLSGLTEPLRSL